MSPSRVRVSFHSIQRARERCPALADAHHEDVEAAIRTLVATGSPWGRSEPHGPRHVIGTIEGVQLVVGLIPSRDGPWLETQTVLTLAQATANAMAFPGQVAQRFYSRMPGSRKVRR